MKRLITGTICILCLTIVTAHARPGTGPASPANPSKNYRDTIKTPAIGQVSLLPAYLAVFKSRLDSIQKDVQLDYNEYVQNYIDIYARHKDEMGHVLGLAKYYFPIYEKAFREAGIPQELKYLSIVESKLDPMAVSSVGATGPWQFMPQTAKLYGLNMDRYTDDRRDPVKASYAAAAYLKDAYAEFGDWLLAIASYNCGKSNVERAIAKAGALDFWSIRPYLPNETRGYVPAYIAMVYVMNYADKHDIIPQTANFHTDPDTVMVNRFVSLNNISSVLNVDIREIALLNPAYKKQIVNGTTDAPRRLVIPKTGQENYAALYDVLNTDMPDKQAYIAADHQETPEFHKVKKGETLISIADTYNVDIQDLKDWNNLRANKVATGKKLWLNDSHESIAAVASTKKEAKFITYHVRPGDTLSVIAAKFDGNSVESLRALNRLKKSTIQPGMRLKISRG